MDNHSSQYKRTNFGDLPGDVPKRDKIKMLEQGGVDLGYYPCYDPSKSFRNIVRRKALKRFRASEKKLIADYMGS